jgi:hypothetical protein
MSEELSYSVNGQFLGQKVSSDNMNKTSADNPKVTHRRTYNKSTSGAVTLGKDNSP